MTLEIDTLADLQNHIGERLGPSDWVLVDQNMIDGFADVTGDRNWYHLDVGRARRELPGGETIAHGLLTLSLAPGLSGQLLNIRNHGRALNYGLNKVRFPVPVPAGGRVRLYMTIARIEDAHGGRLITKEYFMELEGAEKPAMVAEILTLDLS